MCVCSVIIQNAFFLSPLPQDVHGYLSLSICVLGIVSNALNIVVLTRPHMRTPLNLVLTALAAVDMAGLTCYAVFALHFHVGGNLKVE